MREREREVRCLGGICSGQYYDYDDGDECVLRRCKLPTSVVVNGGF